MFANYFLQNPVRFLTEWAIQKEWQWIFLLSYYIQNHHKHYLKYRHVFNYNDQWFYDMTDGAKLLVVEEEPLSLVLSWLFTPFFLILIPNRLQIFISIMSTISSSSDGWGIQSGSGVNIMQILHLEKIDVMFQRMLTDLMVKLFFTKCHQDHRNKEVQNHKGHEDDARSN